MKPLHSAMIGAGICFVLWLWFAGALAITYAIEPWSNDTLQFIVVAVGGLGLPVFVLFGASMGATAPWVRV